MKLFLLRVKLYIRNYFGFSLKETNGFLVLSVLMVVFLFSPLVFEQLYPNEDANHIEDQAILDSLLNVIENNKVEIYKRKSIENELYTSAEHHAHTEHVINLFSFDPNIATIEDFIKLGIELHIAKRIDKYRSKGGKFRKKEDLIKIYGFPETLFKRLEPYIVLVEIKKEKINLPVENGASKTEKLKSNYSKTFAKANINLADSVQLEKVYGIGLKLASRIIKYRSKLGGFVNMGQLEEVYGLDTNVIRELNEKYEVDKNFIPSRININHADIEALKKHPYIGYKFAGIIVSFRQQHGHYHGAEQLKEIKILMKQDIEKMRPYIEF